VNGGAQGSGEPAQTWLRRCVDEGFGGDIGRIAVEENLALFLVISRRRCAEGDEQSHEVGVADVKGEHAPSACLSRSTPFARGTRSATILAGAPTPWPKS
jgi:hypothetical protein